MLGEPWAEEVARVCDPVFEAADVGFVRQVSYAGDEQNEVVYLLWEADPQRFADRYPDSGIVETYGEDQWRAVHCIDYWVNLDQANRRCRLQPRDGICLNCGWTCEGSARGMVLPLRTRLRGYSA